MGKIPHLIFNRCLAGSSLPAADIYLTPPE